ncbi:MAG TPA: hypothetical protein VIX86_06190 [Streptosporangiaceae bacterium]
MPAVPSPGNRPSASERIAALFSLASLVAAALLTVAGIAIHLAGVILALAGVLAGVTGCWYLVSRRGLIRLAALAVTVTAAAALVAGLFLADISVWRAAIIVVLAIVSAATGRHALRRTPAALRSAASRAPAAGPARQPVLIMNLKSGGGKAER